ncbi:MAG: DNA methyltransferase [Promethearchaeota archaeon]
MVGENQPKQLKRSKKYLQLDWYGKKQAQQQPKQPSDGSFVLDRARSLGSTAAKHRFYEGDNRHIMQFLLAKEEKYDLIFADPPYNSPKDVIMNDYFPDSPRFWSNQVSHPKWLSMMYPRLQLAKKLLHPEHGLLFITIDDKEQHYLRVILDEIFGEDNFIGTFIWKSMASVKSNALFTVNHTYVLVYAKDRRFWKAHSKSFRSLRQGFESIWDDVDTSIQAREQLEKTLEGIIPSDYIRFLNPKPINFLRRILNFCPTGKHSRILDMFSGTGSLFIAAMEQNAVDTGSRMVVGMQYNFEISEFLNTKNDPFLPPDFHTLFDIALYRIQAEFLSKSGQNQEGIRVYKRIEHSNK